MYGESAAYNDLTTFLVLFLEMMMEGYNLDRSFITIIYGGMYLNQKVRSWKSFEKKHITCLSYFRLLFLFEKKKNRKYFLKLSVIHQKIAWSTLLINGLAFSAFLAIQQEKYFLLQTQINFCLIIFEMVVGLVHMAYYERKKKYFS